MSLAEVHRHRHPVERSGFSGVKRTGSKRARSMALRTRIKMKPCAVGTCCARTLRRPRSPE